MQHMSSTQVRRRWRLGRGVQLWGLRAYKTRRAGAMSESTRRGIAILASALVLGTLGDGLFRTWPWGLNVPLWVIALVAVTIVLDG